MKNIYHRISGKNMENSAKTIDNQFADNNAFSKVVNKINSELTINLGSPLALKYHVINDIQVYKINLPKNKIEVLVD